MGKSHAKAIAPEEIVQSIDRDKYPAILTPDQAAELLQVSRYTVYRWSSEGRFRHAMRRGKPLRIFRDRLIRAFFEEG